MDNLGDWEKNGQLGRELISIKWSSWMMGLSSAIQGHFQQEARNLDSSQEVLLMDRPLPSLNSPPFQNRSEDVKALLLEATLEKSL
jgi:hypothetical protein